MTGAKSCDIYRIARECGIKLYDGHLHSPASRKPFECFCKPTLRAIGRTCGTDHLRLVLRLMTGTRENAAELYADMLRAVSAVIVANPGIERRPDLVRNFDTIDLGDLRDKAKTMNCGLPAGHVLRVLIGLRFFAAAKDTLPDMPGAALATSGHPAFAQSHGG